VGMCMARVESICLSGREYTVCANVLGCLLERRSAVIPNGQVLTFPSDYLFHRRSIY